MRRTMLNRTAAVNARVQKVEDQRISREIEQNHNDKTLLFEQDDFNTNSTPWSTEELIQFNQILNSMYESSTTGDDDDDSLSKSFGLKEKQWEKIAEKLGRKTPECQRQLHRLIDGSNHNQSRCMIKGDKNGLSVTRANEPQIVSCNIDGNNNDNNNNNNNNNFFFSINNNNTTTQTNPKNTSTSCTIAFFSNPAMHHSKANARDWFQHLVQCGYKPEWWNILTNYSTLQQQQQQQQPLQQLQPIPSLYPSPYQEEPYDIAIGLQYNGTFDELIQITHWLKRVAFRSLSLQSFFQQELQDGLIFWFHDDQIAILIELMEEHDLGVEKEKDKMLGPKTIRQFPAGDVNSPLYIKETTEKHGNNPNQTPEESLAQRSLFTTQVYISDWNLIAFLRLVTRMNAMMKIKGKE